MRGPSDIKEDLCLFLLLGMLLVMVIVSYAAASMPPSVMVVAGTRRDKNVRSRAGEKNGQTLLQHVSKSS